MKFWNYRLIIMGYWDHDKMHRRLQVIIGCVNHCDIEKLSIIIRWMRFQGLKLFMIPEACVNKNLMKDTFGTCKLC